jgi:hypothetical protein
LCFFITRNRCAQNWLLVPILRLLKLQLQRQCCR